MAKGGRVNLRGGGCAKRGIKKNGLREEFIMANRRYNTQVTNDRACMSKKVDQLLEILHTTNQRR
jgi:hypothetical protein